VDDKLNQMRTELSDVRTVLGDVYELSARSKVSKFEGSHYTSKFKIFDLNGLIKLAFYSHPKMLHMILRRMFQHIVLTNSQIIFM
jgi:hypothetical protein